jgi:hypothetical protein
VNQFVHSLYPRPPPLRNLLEGLNLLLFQNMAIIITWDATGQHIHFAFLFGSGPVMPDGCMRFEISDSPAGSYLTVKMTVSDNSVGNCVIACQNRGYPLAGVENGTQCCTCITS